MKILKIVLFGVLILVVIFIIIPIILGILSSVNPREAIKKANQKVAENASVYVPISYQVTKQGQKETIKDREVFVTQFVSNTNTITIYQRTSSDFTCENTKVTISNRELCLKVMDSKNGKYEDYMWDTGIARYELGTSANKLSVNELSKIVASLP